MSIKSVIPSNHLILCRSLLLPSIFPSIGVFPSESALHIRRPKYWSFSFSISPSNEYSRLISFRMDYFLLESPCCPRDSQESSPTPQFKSINTSPLNFLYSPTLTSIHDYRKNHSFDSQLDALQISLVHSKPWLSLEQGTEKAEMIQMKSTHEDSQPRQGDIHTEPAR